MNPSPHCPPADSMCIPRSFRGVCMLVVTDRHAGKRYIYRDPDPSGRERSVQLHQSRWGGW